MERPGRGERNVYSHPGSFAPNALQCNHEFILAFLNKIEISQPPPPPILPALRSRLTHPSAPLRLLTDVPRRCIQAAVPRLLAWHRWAAAAAAPAWPSYKAALPAKSGPAHSGAGELEWVRPYCAAPASPLEPYPRALCAAPPPRGAPLPSASPPHPTPPRAVKPVKSTKLTRSDGRGQNSI